MKNEILNNPYDYEREYIIHLLRNHVSYFKFVSTNLLKEIYYLAKHLFLGKDEILFDIGDDCDSIYIVLSGVLEIIITDSDDKYKRIMDLCGRGSIIGANFVLIDDK